MSGRDAESIIWCLENNMLDALDKNEREYLVSLIERDIENAD